MSPTPREHEVAEQTGSSRLLGYPVTVCSAADEDLGPIRRSPGDDVVTHRGV